MPLSYFFLSIIVIFERSSITSTINPNGNKIVKYFMCENDMVKIPIESVCDHEIDCIDGSDEGNCPSSVTTMELVTNSQGI